MGVSVFDIVLVVRLLGRTERQPHVTVWGVVVMFVRPETVPV